MALRAGAEAHGVWEVAAPGQGAPGMGGTVLCRVCLSRRRRSGRRFLVMTSDEGARSRSRARGELPTE